MLYARLPFVTLVLLAYQVAATPVQSSIETPNVSSRGGTDDVELRAISRSSWKRNQVASLTPRIGAMNLDYIDG